MAITTPLLTSIPAYISLLNLRPIWQGLPFVTKLFVPSVRCPFCSHANDSDFRFCKHCGYTRKILSSRNKSGSLKFDLNSIDKRLQQLLNFDQATSYSKQKDTLRKELEAFLSALPGHVSLATVSPGIYVVFLFLRIRMVGCRSTITAVNLLHNGVNLSLIHI